MNESRRIGLRFALTAFALSFFVATYAAADPPGKKHFHARLDGGQETPAISTTGTGEFKATLNDAGTELSYELKFSGLSSSAMVAHVHLGQFDVAGGIVFFLCGGGGKPTCPASGGTVTGTVTSSDILAVPLQGIAAGDFDKVITAMRERLTYANVHSANFPAGEIRGQIDGERGEREFK